MICHVIYIFKRYFANITFIKNHIIQSDTIPVAEYLMSANKLAGVKQERTNDRLGAIVFSTLGKISVKEKTKKEVGVICLYFKFLPNCGCFLV